MAGGCDRLKLGSRVLQASSEAVVLSYGDDDQRVRIELVRAFDEPWALFISPIVEASKARLQNALEFNMRLSIGALAIEQAHLVLRATCALSVLDEASLDATSGSSLARRRESVVFTFL